MVDAQTHGEFQIRLRQKYPNAVVLLQNWGDHLKLESIRLHPNERGKGTGSKIMQDIVEYSDKHQVPVALTPDPVYGGNVKRLKEFYSRFGFQRNKGRGVRLEISESYIREPKEENKMAYEIKRTTEKGEGREPAYRLEYEREGRKYQETFYSDQGAENQGVKAIDRGASKVKIVKLDPSHFEARTDLGSPLTHEERELELYEENNPDLVKQREAFLKNQERRIKAGTYDKEKAKKLWRYHIDRAAKAYNREFGSSGGRGYGIFDTKTRNRLASRYAVRGERVVHEKLRNPNKRDDDPLTKGFEEYDF